MLIQINLPEDISKEIKIYKIRNNLNTQEEVIIKILKEVLKKEDINHE